MMNSFTNTSAMRSGPKHEFEPMFAGRTPSPSTRKKVVTEDDVVAARAEGFAQGQADANASLERASTESLRAIATMMQMMLGRLASEADNLRADAAEVAIAAAKAIATTALDAFGEEAILDIVSTAVAQMRDAPRLVVKVSPELVSTMEERLIGCAREAGFSGEIFVREDATASNGDCTLDWGDAIITHDRASAFEAIELAAQKWLASAQSEGFQIDMYQT
jgi:flagellar assembly protein FliH